MTIAALKTPTSLRDTKGEGERTEKGTKRKQKKGDCRLQMDTIHLLVMQNIRPRRKVKSGVSLTLLCTLS